MLTQEENELLTRTGPGTPMGELLRQYWAPALLSAELPELDGAPVRITLMGEELIAFRDSEGRVGLLEAHCPHRGASLFFGRNEVAGLRCVYHGWKFDVTGACVDMPSEPAESSFKHKVQANAYPCVERGGLVWAYLGPHQTPPPLPELEWALVPDGQRVVSKRIQECNYLQALEGGVDLSHLGFLHRNLGATGDRRGQEMTQRDPVPRFEIVDTEYGLLIASRRNAEEGRYYWRINQFLMPWYTMFPPLVDEGIGGHAWVPIDDERCWAFSMTWNPRAPLAVERQEGKPTGEGIYSDLIPGTFRPRANKDNDYLIDREVQRRRSYTGIPGFAAQDCVVQESMGPVCDRTREHIGASDLPIIALRRRLQQALAALQSGMEPPGLDPATYAVRPVALVLPTNVPFHEGAREALRAS